MKTPWQVHLIALIVVIFTLVAEIMYLFIGIPTKVPEVLLGRVLGTLDGALMLVLAFYYSGTLRLSISERAADKIPPPPPPEKGPV